MSNKTFFDLKQEVQVTGKCHGCGGCVTFCTAINYGALEMGGDGLPRYKSVEKCIDCGLCYRICPAVNEHEQELRRHYHWSAPAGRIQGVHSARVRDPFIRARATDGGAVTGMLLHLFDKGHIEGAIVTHQENGNRKPLLASTRDEIIRSAGTSFDLASGMAEMGSSYSSYSPSIQAMGDLLRTGLRRIAFVGTPCQIKSVRKMQLLGVVPADAVRFCFGLFCSANYTIDPRQLGQMGALSGHAISDLVKVNVKDDIQLYFGDGQPVRIPLKEMQRFRRPACGHCHEFAADYADISFGGVGSEEGWTTVVTRTALGRALFADALESMLEVMSIDEHRGCTERAMTAVLESSVRKQALLG